MLSEIRRGDLTSLIRSKEDPKYWDELRAQDETEFKPAIKILYDYMGAILDRFPQVPPEEVNTLGDKLYAVKYPHRLTPAVSFVNAKAEVGIRMRELVAQHLGESVEHRYGVRIEVADESLPILSRTLFSIYPVSITTCWEHGGVIHSLQRLQDVETIGVLVEQIERKLPRS